MGVCDVPFCLDRSYTYPIVIGAKKTFRSKFARMNVGHLAGAFQGIFLGEESFQVFLEHPSFLVIPNKFYYYLILLSLYGPSFVIH